MATQKNEIKSSALELIGNTPIVALDRVYTGPGRILAKCEYMNPGGSVKCRSALGMINKARNSGELKSGAPVIENTSGNQGVGLAVVCAVLGHPLTLTTSAGTSLQRAVHMEALGAKCIRVPQDDGTPGCVTYSDMKAAEEVALDLVEKQNGFFVNQSNNQNNPDVHYETTGPEIWRQTGHRVDAFCAMVGTAGTFMGTSRYLKEQNQNVKAYVVEPAGAEAIKGDPVTKPRHLLQGAGYGQVPNLFDFDYLDGTLSITDEEAIKYKRLLGEKEGLYVGYTSGANVAAAVKLLESGVLPKDAWVVTMLNDTGLKYSRIS